MCSNLSETLGQKFFILLNSTGKKRTPVPLADHQILPSGEKNKVGVDCKCNKRLSTGL